VKAGDLVVRLWCDKPRWDMIGIIIKKEFLPISSGGAKWEYRIMWSRRMFQPFSNTPVLSQTWNESEFRVIS